MPISENTTKDSFIFYEKNNFPKNLHFILESFYAESATRLR
jgi:hypothetical protein